MLTVLQLAVLIAVSKLEIIEYDTVLIDRLQSMQQVPFHFAPDS